MVTIECNSRPTKSDRLIKLRDDLHEAQASRQVLRRMLASIDHQIERLETSRASLLGVAFVPQFPFTRALVRPAISHPLDCGEVDQTIDAEPLQ